MLRSITFILKDEAREQKENNGCFLAKCKRCGKEFYTIGRWNNTCKACLHEREKKKLLKEQYRLARRLGLRK